MVREPVALDSADFMNSCASSALRFGSQFAVYVASNNNVKINAVKDAFCQLKGVKKPVSVTGAVSCVDATQLHTSVIGWHDHPLSYVLAGVLVPSGVPEQPFGDTQTLLGCAFSAYV